ncbi:MAG TPA: PIN domain-containing protein, partial [Candidatus Ozemobacteraceae bacterium]|nr:PIN domain-containing protein [Candidatus Ozemobacteraceae bacterium]
MSGEFLLDTNIVIALFADEPLLMKRLTPNRKIFVSTIVLGELFYGAHKAARSAENLKRISEFAEKSAIVVPDYETADSFGQIKSRLLSKGRPIPDNDIWIAATAIQH